MSGKNQKGTKLNISKEMHLLKICNMIGKLRVAMQIQS